MVDSYAQFADFYDHVVPYRTRADVSFFVDEARRANGKVLEIGCGTGRILIPTARAGVEIVGIDLSENMLAICRQRLAEESDFVRARAHLAQADMRAFDLGQTFSLVTIPFRPFQHLMTVEDQLACLAAIRRHMTAGSRLIVDVFNPSLDALARTTGPDAEEEGDEPEFVMPDGRRVLRRYRITAQDRVNQTNHVELIYRITHPDGRSERAVHAFPMRYLFRFELEHLLARSGFAVERVYAGYDRSSPGSIYPGELIVIAALS